MAKTPSTKEARNRNISARISQHSYEWLRDYSDRTGQSISEIVQEALEALQQHDAQRLQQYMAEAQRMVADDPESAARLIARSRQSTKERT